MSVAMCPNPADLERLLLGGLSEEDAAVLEEHVLRCGSCLDQLKALLTVQNTLTGLLKNASRGDAAGGPLVEELVQRLKSLRSSGAGHQDRGVARIVFPCSVCQKKLSVKPELTGKKVKCPGCGQVTLVPVPVASAAGLDNADLKTLPPSPDGERSQAGGSASGSRPSTISQQPTVPPVGEADNPAALQGRGSGPAPNLTDFLGPPQSADELGRLGKYRVRQSIGVGGMGMVFLAEDTRLNRQVALKVIKPDLLQRPDLHERFLSEAQAIAAVEHDNIVAIYEADDIAGVPYLVMPLLLGESLEHYLRKCDGPLPIDDILSIGREIAAGLAAAHERNMIHRDIKPNNIWLEQKDAGNPSSDPTAPKPDAGAPPVLLAPTSLIEKLLAKKPEQRCASAQQVVAEIQEIERQRQPRSWRRWLLSTAACVALALGGSFALFSYLHHPPPPVQPCDVTFEYDEPDALLVLQGNDGSEQEFDARQAPLQQLLPGEYVIRPKTPDQNQRRLWPDHFVVNPDEPQRVPLALVGLVKQFFHHSLTVKGVAFTPRPDSWLALSASLDRSVVLWNTQQDDKEINLAHVGMVYCVAFSGDGKYALSGSGLPRKGKRPGDNCVRLWDLATHQCIDKLEGHDNAVEAVAFDPKGKWLLSADARELFFWDAHTRQRLGSVPAHDRLNVHGLAFLPDGKQALSCGGDKKLLLWDVDKRRLLKTLSGHEDTVSTIH